MKISRENDVVLQVQVTDCGLASLSMISHNFGNFVSLSQLRSNYDVSIEYGLTLFDLSRIAGNMGLNAVGCKFNTKTPEALDLPCILHWGHNHFVVLESVHRGKLTIADPAMGRRTLSLEQASKFMSGFALEFTSVGMPTVALRGPQGKFELRDVFAALGNLKYYMGLLVFVGILVQCIALITPLYVKESVDSILAYGNVDFVVAISVLFAFVYLFEFVIDYMNGTLRSLLTRSTDLRLNDIITSKLFSLPLSFFKNRRVGDIVDRMSSTRRITMFVVSNLSSAITSVFACAIALALMFILDIYLAAISVAFVTILLALRYVIARKVQIYAAGELAASGRATSTLVESIGSIQTIRALGLAERQLMVWRRHFGSEVATSRDQDRVNVLYQSLSKALQGFEQIAVIVWASYLIIDEQMTVGTIYAFIQYKRLFLTNATTAIEFNIDRSTTKSHFERVDDIVSVPVEATLRDDDASPLRSTVNFSDGITLKDLNWRPPTTLRDLLKEVSCHFPPGQTSLIVGRSGSGKSTLLDLLAGLYKIQDKAVFTGDQDLADVALDAWREKIASVSPRDTILQGTILENISGMSATPDMRRAEQAAQIALISDTIKALHNGYFTDLASGSGFLSSGELQRILLARAIYRQPQILLLDEFQANLDQDTAEAVWENLQDYQKENGTTIIVASHKPLQGIPGAFFVMADGQLRAADPADMQQGAT